MGKVSHGSCESDKITVLRLGWFTMDQVLARATESNHRLMFISDVNSVQSRVDGDVHRLRSLHCLAKPVNIAGKPRGSVNCVIKNVIAMYQRMQCHASDRMSSYIMSLI
jgi:hypothetical protein